MKLFTIEGDSNNYRSYRFDKELEKQWFDFNGTPLLTTWKGGTLISYEPKKRASGFAYVELGTFVMNQESSDALSHELRFTELLPVSYNTSPLLLINPPYLQNSIVQDKSTFEVDKYEKLNEISFYEVKWLVLRKSAIDNHSIFRTEISDKNTIYVTQAFVDKVKQEGLKGFLFEQIGEVIGDEDTCQGNDNNASFEYNIEETQTKYVNTQIYLEFDIPRFNQEIKDQIIAHCKQSVDQLIGEFLNPEDTLEEVKYGYFNDGRNFDINLTIIKLENGEAEAYEHLDQVLVHVLIDTDESIYPDEEKEVHWQEIMEVIQLELKAIPYKERYKLSPDFTVGEIEILD